MNRNLIVTFVFLWNIFFINISSVAQQTPEQYICKEYPNLYTIFADSIGKQTAHYIFVIDVSTFMRTNLPVLKPMVIDFINALTDGDQVTLIRKSSTENSGIVNGIEALKIDAKTKKHIIDVLNSSEFDIKNLGSDGYTAISTAIEAIIQPKSSDLVFLFMFTDFEYWTQKNQCNKNAEDWNKLKKKISPFIVSKKRVILPYAIFFPDIPQACSGKNADYRYELNEIFGNLSQPPSNNKAVLNNWFEKMKINTLVYRLKYIIYRNIDDFTIKPELKSDNKGATVSFKFNSNLKHLDLFENIQLIVNKSPVNKQNFLIPLDSLSCKNNKQVRILSINNEKRKLFPSWCEISGEIDFSVVPIFRSQNEIERLNQIDNLISIDYLKKYQFIEKLPKKNIFLHLIPTWLDILIIILILVWIVCFFITKFRKITRNWQVSVSWKDSNGTSRYVSEDFINIKNFTIGRENTQTNHLSVNGAEWKIRVFSKSNFPCKFWVKTGYYIYIEEGSFMDLEYPYGADIKVIGSGREYLLSSIGRFRGGKINVSQRNINFTIELN